MEHKLTVLLMLVIASVNAFTIEKKLIEPEGRIYEGDVAAEDSVPYHVSLQKVRGHICSGAIVGDMWIITSASCVSGERAANIVIFTGSQTLRDPSRILYLVDRIYIHWSFDKNTSDIALVRVDSPIRFNSHTQIVPLTTKPLKRGDQVTLTSWGIGKEVKKLNKIDLQFMPLLECRKTRLNSTDVDIGEICSSGEATCLGDTGSPVVSDGHLVGVHIGPSKPCGMGDPNVHTNIYYYLDWIRSIMSDNDGCRSNGIAVQTL